MKKKKLIDKKQFNKSLYCISYSLMLVCVCYGFLKFGLAFHGIDVAYNMANLKAKYNIEFIDTASNLKEYSQKEIYINNINQLFASLTLISLGCLIAGMMYITYFPYKK